MVLGRIRPFDRECIGHAGFAAVVLPISVYAIIHNWWKNFNPFSFCQNKYTVHYKSARSLLQDQYFLPLILDLTSRVRSLRKLRQKGGVSFSPVTMISISWIVCMSGSVSMAAIIQHLARADYGGSCYPLISRVSQSHNYWPVLDTQADEGIVHIAPGISKTVAGGEKTLWFC